MGMSDTVVIRVVEQERRWRQNEMPSNWRTL
jgi:hypothetical protein